MKEMNRRDYMKTVAIGGAVLGLGSAVLHKPLEALASGKFDIGQCKSVRIKCVSELGWFDTNKLLATEGGSNQWLTRWDPENAAGSCSLIDMESLDGSHHKFLIDTGWNNQYMDEAFIREGIDKMLKSGEIEFLIISHEHLDHYWGLESTLKHNPEIKIIIPSTFYSEGMDLLSGAEFVTSNVRNVIPHKGELLQIKPGTINKLYEGCAVVAFDLFTILRVRGEESLYFNVKDKGIVCVTGCCHQTILTFADFAQNKIVGGDNMYGIYGGLHIAPFGPMDYKGLNIVKGMAKYNFQKVACNHCTGLDAVEKMIELGYPVVGGTGSFGSKSNLYIGNGDEVVFGYGEPPTFVEKSEIAPSELDIKGNFPNPFNPSTSIRFSLPHEGTVQFSIYNVMGQKVRTLIDGMMTGGIHRIRWDGKNDRGQALASGVYIARLRAGKEVSAHRMLLIR